MGEKGARVRDARREIRDVAEEKGLSGYQVIGSSAMGDQGPNWRALVNAVALKPFRKRNTEFPYPPQRYPFPGGAEWLSPSP